MAEIDVLHPETPRDERLLPWRAFLVAHARITRRLDEELRVEHDLSLGEYDALLALAEATDRRLRMNSLADRVVLSKSGVTRLIDRLVLMTFPVLLGRGKRIFDGAEQPGALKLVESFVSNKGVVFATYEPAGEVPTGTFATKEPSEAELKRRRKWALEEA